MMRKGRRFIVCDRVREREMYECALCIPSGPHSDHTWSDRTLGRYALV